MVTGILRYPGGKSKKAIRDRLLSYAPREYSEYIEPFCGGAGLFWAIDKNKQRWLNDINPYLMSVYEALRDRPDDFIGECRNIDPASKGMGRIDEGEKAGKSPYAGT